MLEERERASERERDRERERDTGSDGELGEAAGLYIPSLVSIQSSRTNSRFLYLSHNKLYRVLSEVKCQKL